jgi:hypothetical protein
MVGKRVPIIADQDSPVVSIKSLNTANTAITSVNAIAGVCAQKDGGSDVGRQPMKPATKYAAALALYRQETARWEYELFDELRRHYPEHELQALREDLVGMSTLGWLDIIEQREHAGQILRRYALRPEVRPFLEYQLDLDKIAAALQR